MEIFLQLLVSGLANGAVYAIVAFGYVVIFNVAGWLNFPQGNYMMFGAFFTLTFLALNLPLPVAAILAIIITTGIGILFGRLAIGRMRQPTANMAILIMIGAIFLFDGIKMVSFGKFPKSLPFFSEQFSVEFAGAHIPTQSLWVVGITLILGIALWYFFNRQLYGKAMRAVAQNPLAAKLAGINTRRLVILAVAISSGIGALGGIAIAPLTFIVFNAAMLFTLRGFIAAVIGGGLVSYPGAFLGGVVVGLIEAFTIGYVTSLYKDVVLFSVLIIILLWRPTGILGPREAKN